MGRFSLVLVGAALSLAGCGQSGSEYLGKWEREKTIVNGSDWKLVKKNILTIDRNGNEFMVRSAYQTISNNETSAATPIQNTPAVFKDGQLQLHGGLVSYTIDKASGHLVPPDGAGEYTRVK